MRIQPAAPGALRRLTAQIRLRAEDGLQLLKRSRIVLARAANIAHPTGKIRDSNELTLEPLCKGHLFGLERPHLTLWTDKFRLRFSIHLNNFLPSPASARRAE